jgi:hypothetical protein
LVVWFILPLPVLLITSKGLNQIAAAAVNS